MKGLARVVVSTLGEGEEVTIPGLVRLSPKHREARTGRHPVTGAPIAIAKRRVVNAKAVKALADHVA